MINRNKWSSEEKTKLKKFIDSSKTLNAAFNKSSKVLGRSIGGISQYYYKNKENLMKSEFRDKSSSNFINKPSLEETFNNISFPVPNGKSVKITIEIL